MSLAMATADMIPPPSSEDFLKAIISSSMSPSTSSSSSSSSSVAADGGAAFSDDGCSICLEPFSFLHDPPTVTNCNHEYHLHCILEWSQRSTECPICCQLLALKNPTSQELLEAAKSERVIKSRSNIRIVREDCEVIFVAPYVNDSDLEEQILQHLSAPAGRTHNDRRRRETSTGIDSSEVFSPVSFGTMTNMRSIDSQHDRQSVDYGLEVGSTMKGAPGSIIEPELSPVLTGENRDGPLNHRIFLGQTSPDGPRRSSSEVIAFSESVKAKFSAASARYKESITKSTHGFKEKLLARNSTVKELGRGVQREMSAGIAGVARMIEGLDLSSKRTGVSVPFSASSVEKPNLADRGPSLEESATTRSPVAVPGETMHGMNSGISPFNSTTIPGRVEVSLI